MVPDKPTVADTTLLQQGAEYSTLDAVSDTSHSTPDLSELLIKERVPSLESDGIDTLQPWSNGRASEIKIGPAQNLLGRAHIGRRLYPIRLSNDPSSITLLGL